MIGKITKGSRAGSIGAYLHGPGRANEHSYKDAYGRDQDGGKVIASNLQVLGDTDSKRWAPQLRETLVMRDREVKQPIWQVSLALPPHEKLTQQQWADAAQTFVEQLGVQDRPWVAVHHGASAGGNDHIHIVLNRVNYQGELWAAKHDYRQVQKAATHLEKVYGLSHAPRTRDAQSVKRTPKQTVHETQQAKVGQVQKMRRIAEGLRVANPVPAKEIPQLSVKQRLEREVEKIRAEKLGEAQRRGPQVEPPKRGRGVSR